MPNDGPDSSNRPQWWTEQRVWLETNIDFEALRLFAMRDVGDSQTAHDIVQKWLDYMSSQPMSTLAKLRKPQAVAYDAIRKRILNWKRDNRKFVQWDDLTDHDFSSEQLQLQTDEQALELLGLLPPEDAETLYLHKSRGYSVRQVAAELGISESLVRSRVAWSATFLNPSGVAPNRRSVVQRIRKLLNGKERKP